ncbi:MAG: S-methyl-5-thioribose kinase [Rhodobacteraceae bacterium]|nr:S-methyl-5-thioribose kinase [Paracoccaceae bacterium]
MSSEKYEPLTIETLADRLGSVDAICKIVGDDTSKWKIDEVGDGNLNLVYTVSSDAGDIIVKQALPYVRLVGDSWPLPLSRSFYEHEVLVRQAKRDPGSVPQIIYFNKVQAIIAMEMLLPHVILRKKLIAGEYVDGLAQRLGEFCARTAFRGSDLSLQTADKKSDTALFQGNLALMGITESLVFTEPYFAAEMNHHTDGLDPIVRILRSDVEMKTEAQRMLLKFTANTETLCHGDLHSGSVMCTDNETKVIDPEFGFYGPMGFDIGMLISNYLMAYFSQPSHRESDTLLDYQTWILKVIEGTCEAFQQEFKNLWNSERTGILFPQSMFEDQGDSSEFALNEMLEHIWQDAVAISGIEMHRRVLSLAHNADFEEISDTKKRSQLEARNLMMGRELILNSKTIKNASELTTMARKFNSENYL